MQYLDTAVRFILAVLLSGLWQVPLFALAAWLVLRVSPRANATTRHSVLATALFASLLLPVATATLSLRHAADVVRGTSETQIPRAAVHYKPATSRPPLPERERTTDLAAASPAANAPAFALPAPSRFNLAVPRALAFGLVGLWLAGAAFVLLRLTLSLLHLERLKRDALPLPVDYREHLTRWNAASKGERAVRLCTSDEIEIPIAVGLFDAMILVPGRLLEELEPHDVDSIVLHELAHLRRADDWLNAVERVALALLFFNPGMRWLASKLDLEREVACDDWVLQQNDALPYASCLARVVETTSWPYRAMSAPGAFVTRRGMSIRIERLLSKQRDVRVRTSFGPAGAAVAMVAAVGIVAAVVSPSIAYDVERTASATAAQAAPVAAASAAREARATAPLTAKHVTSAARPAAEHEASPETKTLARTPTPRTPAVAPDKPAASAQPAAPAHPDIHVDVQVAVPPPSGVAFDQVGTTFAPPPQPSPPPSHARHGASDDVQRAAKAEAEAARQEAAADRAAEHASVRAEQIADASDPDFIDELNAAGYRGLSIDQLVQLKAVGVDGDFIQALRRAGLDHLNVNDLVKLRALNVSPAYVAAMRKRFGNGADVGKISELRAVGASSDYIDELNAAGLTGLTPEDVRDLRALNVSAKYVRDLKAAGYPRLDTSDLRQLKALGIDGAFIERAAAHGFRDVPIEQLIKLKATGVL